MAGLAGCRKKAASQTDGGLSSLGVRGPREAWNQVWCQQPPPESGKEQSSPCPQETAWLDLQEPSSSLPKENYRVGGASQESAFKGFSPLAA